MPKANIPPLVRMVLAKRVPEADHAEYLKVYLKMSAVRWQRPKDSGVAYHWCESAFNYGLLDKMIQNLVSPAGVPCGTRAYFRRAAGL